MTLGRREDYPSKFPIFPSQILQPPTSTPPTHTPYLICFISVLMNTLTSGVFTHLFLQSNKAK